MQNRVWWGNLRERDHLEDPGVDGSKILRRKLECVGTDWIELAQDRDSFRTLLNTKNFLTS